MAVGTEREMKRSSKCSDRVHELVMPNASDSLHDIRVFASEAIADLPMGKPAQWDIVLAVGEAATNCVVHGQSTDGRCNRITTRIVVGRDEVRIELHDDGRHFHPDMTSWPPPDLASEKGRGIFIIKTLMDDVSYPRVNRGTLCVLTKKFVPGK